MPDQPQLFVIYCGNENRREQVRVTLGADDLPLLNGIDYLEISNTAQTELQLTFIHPLPGETGGVPDGAPALTPENIVISGGDRIPDIEVDSVAANDERLTVTVNTPGDFSTYTLRLAADANAADPPPGFDPQLSKIDFSFKAACPSDFDCRTDESCLTEPPPSPRIDYLARDYQSYRRVLLDRLRLLMPNWRETSPADFPIAVTELLAYVGDQLTYSQEWSSTEAYPGRALNRISLKRHARLRDYFVSEGINARAWIQMDVEPGGAADGALIETGQPFFAGSNDQLTLARDGKFEALHPDKSAIFEAMESLTVRAAHNRFEIYTWSDNECVLCQGAVQATLRRPAGASLETGMVLVFQEMRDPRVPENSQLVGRPDRRWAVRLTGVEETTDVLTGDLLYEVRWDRDDALPFSFILSRRIEDTLIENITVALGNVLLADHGLTVHDDPHDPSLSLRQVPIDGGKYAPVLQETGLTFCQSLADPKSTSATQCLKQSLQQARPQVWLESGGERWQAVPDLLSSDRDAAEFVVEVDNKRLAHLRFGNGEYGRRPALGKVFSAVFRTGNGVRGNVGADAISAILRPGGGFRRVRNPLAATGGKPPELMEEIRQFAPVAFRTQNRAVTLEDYESMALRHEEVQQAKAEFRWQASWYTVTLAVDRMGGLAVDEAFRESLLAHMEQFRMAGYDLEIREPVYVPLDISLMVCLVAGASRTAAYRELKERLGSAPQGLFHPDKLTFGQRIYTSRIIEQARAVPGVDHVALLRFQRFRQPPADELNQGFLEVSGLELPQLADDPSFPERGVLKIELKGGS